MRWFMKMSVWSLACQQSVFQRCIKAKNIYRSFTHMMAAKASWHWNYVTVTPIIRTLDSAHNIQVKDLNLRRHRQHCFVVSGGRCELGITLTAGTAANPGTGGGGVVPPLPHCPTSLSTPLKSSWVFPLRAGRSTNAFYAFWDKRSLLVVTICHTQCNTIFSKSAFHCCFTSVFCCMPVYGCVPSFQSCPRVYFVWPDPTQPVSWLTQPKPLQLEKFGPNPIQLTTELTV